MQYACKHATDDAQHKTKHQLDENQRQKQKTNGKAMILAPQQSGEKQDNCSEHYPYNADKHVRLIAQLISVHKLTHKVLCSAQFRALQMCYHTIPYGGICQEKGGFAQ